MVVVAFVGIGMGSPDAVELAFMGGDDGEPEILALEDEVGIRIVDTELRLSVKVVR